MSGASYGQLEALLRRRGFTRTHAGLHSVWANIDASGAARRVIVCNKPLRPIPPQVLHRIAAQIGMSEEDLRRELAP
ncbi:MAG: type II toxin-antitoxin system HicA family toxin [Armatimonadota bacterium]